MTDHRLTASAAHLLTGCLAGLLYTLPALAALPADDAVYFASAQKQTEADDYTRYELQAPQSASFKIFYEIAATTAGAKFYYNPIRAGSAASEESVYDAMTGCPLPFEIIGGEQARRDPLMTDADPAVNYIKVTLARPVPKDGAARLLIVKTYRDAKSYFLDGRTLVFNRPLGVKRNKVVLPAGFEIVALSVPAQILTEKDGRLAVSFMHAGAGDAPLEIRAINDAQAGAAALPATPTSKRSWESPFTGETEEERLSERAHQDRSIVYFLQQPQSHSFMLYHEYTETRPGINGYANVVRTGSTASHPSASIIDTGELLQAHEMSGAQFAATHINVGEQVDAGARVVVIPFATIKPGESKRLRIAETYTAPVSYRLEGEELVFDRSLGRPRNAVVLPSGWYVTASAEPATVSSLPDGRVRLDYWDDHPEPVDVLLKARRRVN